LPNYREGKTYIAKVKHLLTFKTSAEAKISVEVKTLPNFPCPLAQSAVKHLLKLKYLPNLKHLLKVKKKIWPRLKKTC
jgi:hypothetical protein